MDKIRSSCRPADGASLFYCSGRFKRTGFGISAWLFADIVVAHHSVELAELNARIHVADPEAVSELVFLLRITDRHSGIVILVDIRIKSPP